GRGAGPDRGGPRPVRPGGGAAGPAVRAGGRAARRPRAGLRRPRRAGGVVAAAREDEMTRPAETAPPASMSRYVSLAVTACLAAVAGLAFHRVFGFGPVVPVVAVAAVAPTVLCALLSGPRKSGSWPLWISLVLTVVVWLAAFASAELALRTSLRAVPCLPSLGAWAVALPLGVDGPGSNLPLAAAAVVLTAVLARTLGMPSRVVVGFSGGRRAGDAVQVRSGDVTVWPEVKFDGLGWIRFNPLPESGRGSKGNDSVAAGET